MRPPGNEVNMATEPLLADSVVVIKSERRMILYSQGRAFRIYNVAIGLDPVGPKMRQGDGRTPEGRYYIDYRKPDSFYYKALHISYPNQEDRERARAYGFSPGGGIMIHGVQPGAPYDHYAMTEGCIAVTNTEIEEIWALVPDHTPIEIRA
ncbi:MAG: L,D-transpeptidase family protein [Proteobacteria bacterium]|nr:L,D-transpeptidase family protein [Pseudomonadota bacterium]